MPGIGQRLKEAREKSGLEIEDVYLKIKISPNILVALEHDEADTILEPVYVKKFLKQYAEFLGLDGVAVEKEYTQDYGSIKSHDPEPLKVIIPKAKKAAFNFPLHLIKKVIILIIIFAVVFGFIAVVKKIMHRKPIAAVQKIEEAEQEVLTAIPSSDELILMISSTEKVWIELKSDGQVIMKNFLNANSRESWKAKDNFELSVGKPEVISLWLNGQKLEIPQHKKIRKARIDQEGLNL
jgi:cytoskeletal protein RodZ